MKYPLLLYPLLRATKKSLTSPDKDRALLRALVFRLSLYDVRNEPQPLNSPKLKVAEKLVKNMFWGVPAK